MLRFTSFPCFMRGESELVEVMHSQIEMQWIILRSQKYAHNRHTRTQYTGSKLECV